MNLFKSIVLTIAVVLLIICLAMVGVGLVFGSKSKKKFPPVQSDCPDKWTAKSGSSGVSCSPPAGNGKGTAGCGSISASHPQFSGPSGQCNKYKWANKCGVSWNGVTNASQPCGDTSS